MQEVYIVAAKRTPIGSFGGSLRTFSAPQLAARAVQEALRHCGLSNSEVNELIMGCVLQANIGQAPARQVAKLAELPDSVVCTTVNKVCASGLKAIMYAAQNIMTGQTAVAIAGGMESMSQVPFYTPDTRWGNKYGNTQLVDGIFKDGLQDAYDKNAMGCAADLCATQHAITRKEQDEYAIRSYQRSQLASQNGLFKKEIATLHHTNKKGEETIVDTDEEIWNVQFEKIATLKPVFNKDGTSTPANASTINDGAAAVVLMSKSKADSLHIKPLAVIRGFADAEQAPLLFTTTPSLALPKALIQAGLTINELDYIELNEAFSVVALANIALMKLNPNKVNVNGGAVSIGHPLGCSGARILVTLLHILEQRGGRYGAATICNGGGGASALVVERI